MTKEQVCPFQSNQDIVRCDESECMAWREVEINKFDCVLLYTKAS